MSISEAILQFLNDCNLDLSRLVGRGYDGCSTMAGKEGGVQKLIRDKHPKALYFHCASHILNLVINDLNNVKEVQNASGTTKEVINFFNHFLFFSKARGARAPTCTPCRRPWIQFSLGLFLFGINLK